MNTTIAGKIWINFFKISLLQNYILRQILNYFPQTNMNLKSSLSGQIEPWNYNDLQNITGEPRNKFPIPYIYEVP